MMLDLLRTAVGQRLEKAGYPISRLALAQICWMSTADNSALHMARAEAWVFLQDYCQKVTANVPEFLRFAAYREVGNVLRVIEVELASAEAAIEKAGSLDESRTLHCCAQNPDLDQFHDELRSFQDTLEFLPVKVKLYPASAEPIEFDSWVTAVDRDNKGRFTCELTAEISNQLQSQTLRGTITQRVDTWRLQDAKTCLQETFNRVHGVGAKKDEEVIADVWQKAFNSSLKMHLYKQLGTKVAKGYLEKLLCSGVGALGEEIAEAFTEFCAPKEQESD